jgi:hypothetical protein
MAEGKIQVKCGDGGVIEVDLDIAKTWGPIQSAYEGNNHSSPMRVYHSLSSQFSMDCHLTGRRSTCDQ